MPLAAKHLTLMLVAIVLLSGCSLLRYKTAEAPRVTVSDIQLAGFSIFEQKFDVALRMQNPNDFALPITGMEYELFVEDSAVASGVSDRNINVPAFGEQMVTVSVVGNFLNSLTQLQRWQQSGGSELGYRLKGRLKMADVPVKIPFDYAGKFELKQK